MIRDTGVPERMLTDDERRMLERYATADAATFPIDAHVDGSFSWSFGSLASKVFTSRSDAVRNFTVYVDILAKAARVERERTYIVDPPAAPLKDSRDG
jgi:hypothetical protein